MFHIVSGTVFGKSSPSNRINVGMIGTGRWAKQRNIPQFLQSEHSQIVVVCDVDSWRMNNAKRQVEKYYSEKRGKDYSGCKTFHDFRELLQCKDIDAVMISTPDHWHVPIGIAAARAGKHICVEKPLSTCIAHGRMLADAVKKYGVVSRTDSEFRSLDQFKRAVEIVRNGGIGQLTTIHTSVPAPLSGGPIGAQPTMPVPEELDYDFWLGPVFKAPYTEKRVHPIKGYSRPGWMRVEDYCNGMISNWGTHLNDIAQWGNRTDRTGPISVEGSGTFTKGLWNMISSFDLKYTYANGVELIYNIDKPYVKFEGTEGWVIARYDEKVNLSASRLSILQTPAKEFSVKDVLMDKEDFLVAIKESRETLEPVEVGHRTVSICQIGLIATKLGRKINWDPETEKFKDDNAANAMIDRPVRGNWL
jgi:hypothetical protein